MDGFTAAWVFWKKYGEDALYTARNYGEESCPTFPRGERVFVVDVSWSRAAMLEMSERAGEGGLTVLDHHKTAEENLRGLDFATFDMERSGASLAWDYCFPGKPRPWLVNYVEDRDLWHNKLEFTREVSAYLSTVWKGFPDWDAVYEKGLLDARQKGAPIVNYIREYGEQMAEHAMRINVSGVETAIVNVPYLSISEVLAEVGADVPVAIGWFQLGNGKFQYSLRSQHGTDVSRIAVEYGGGGHPGAAGFVSRNPPWELFDMTEVM